MIFNPHTALLAQFLRQLDPQGFRSAVDQQAIASFMHRHLARLTAKQTPLAPDAFHRAATALRALCDRTLLAERHGDQLRLRICYQLN